MWKLVLSVAIVRYLQRHRRGLLPCLACRAVIDEGGIGFVFGNLQFAIRNPKLICVRLARRSLARRRVIIARFPNRAPGLRSR